MNKLTLPIVVLAILAGFGVWFLVRSPSLKDFELDKDKQQFIWDAEHVTFEIETYFGKPFAAALREGDDDAIRELVNDQFRANLFVINGSKKRQVDGFVEEIWDAECQSQETGVDGFIAFFRDRMKGFKQVERARMRVLHIYKADDSPNGWDTELLVTVNGVSNSGNPLAISSHHRARFEYGDDEQVHKGDAAMSWTSVDLKLVESTEPTFREITSDTGLNKFNIPDNWKMPSEKAQQFQFQIAVEDFDLDGDLDIAVGIYDGIPMLLCQQDGKFVDRSREFGLKTWQAGGQAKSALAGWADINNDGYPDLILGRYLYRNMGGLRFKDITEDSGFDVGFDPHGVTVADYDCDGLLDLYISRSHYFQQKVDRAGWVGDDEAGAPNNLWKNLGDGKFQDVTKQANAGGGNRTTFTTSWFYYDDDRYPDLYIANDFAKNVVLRNRGDGTFEDVSDASGAADFATSMGVATGDINNDGKTEIYVANMYSKMGRRIISHVSAEDYPQDIFPQIQGSCAGNRLYAVGSSGHYEDVTDIAGVNEVGWAFAPLLCDFDGDGLLDIYATTGFMSFSRDKPDG